MSKMNNGNYNNNNNTYHNNYNNNNNLNSDEIQKKNMQSVKLVVLGSDASGKTSLIRQFVNHEFDDEYQPTRQKQIYYSTVSANNERIFQLTIVDVPTIFEFPTTNDDEWNFGLTSYGLRSADAYLLVFDATSTNSFHFAKTLREQILRNRLDSLILVAGNKHDLIVGSDSTNNRSLPGGAAIADNRHSSHRRHQKLKLTSTFSGSDCGGGGNSAASFHRKLTKKFASTVRKHWRNPYVECSAKFNWRVTAVFHDVVKLVTQSAAGGAATIQTSSPFDAFSSSRRKASNALPHSLASAAAVVSAAAAVSPTAATSTATYAAGSCSSSPPQDRRHCVLQ